MVLARRDHSIRLTINGYGSIIALYTEYRGQHEKKLQGFRNFLVL
jgi:hypothetical protein